MTAAVAGLGCDVNPYDPSQVPRITITPVVAAPLVKIAWTPEGAQLLRVYRGTVADGVSANIVWSVSATGPNSLRSGIEYGENPPPGGNIDVPAKALILGQAYTVQISRRDPKGTGDGFTNTSNRYESVQTFTLGPGVLPNP